MRSADLPVGLDVLDGGYEMLRLERREPGDLADQVARRSAGA